MVQVEQRSIRLDVFSTLNLDLSLNLPMERAQWEIRQALPVWPVPPVALVHLLSLVYPVGLVQLNKRDKLNKPDEPDKPVHLAPRGIFLFILRGREPPPVASFFRWIE